MTRITRRSVMGALAFMAAGPVAAGSATAIMPERMIFACGAW